MQRLTKQFKQLKAEDFQKFRTTIFCKNDKLSQSSHWRGKRTLQVSNGGKKVAMVGQISEATLIYGFCVPGLKTSCRLGLHGFEVNGDYLLIWNYTDNIDTE
jgi:hypothetical protein